MSDRMELREISFPPKDAPLRDDVRLLGDLVGTVVREQGGEELFSCVEAARHAAIRRRESGETSSSELSDVLSGRDAHVAAEIVRAFSTYFQVVNLAERVHRIRRGRERMRLDTEPQTGSVADTVQKLVGLGLSPGRITELFAEARVEPVFTAHPTESTRRVILDKQERIAQELVARLDPTRTPHEEQVSLAVIRENVTTAWQTDEHPVERPTVADEREHVLYYVSHVLYRILPALHEQLADALVQAGADPGHGIPPLIRPGSWVGGDMDGNPYVDAGTIRATLRRHRDVVVQRYIEDIAHLAANLTQSDARVPISDALRQRSADYATRLPGTANDVPDRLADMGYRTFLRLVEARLRATRTGDDIGYTSPDDFIDDIELVERSLQENRGAHAGLFGVRRLLARARTFGLHLAVLDVRQDARELRDVVAEILDEPEWVELDPVIRAERLRGFLTSQAPPVTNDSSEQVARTLDVFRAIREGQDRYGPESIGTYIISMAQNVDDVLTVLWLATLGTGRPVDELSLDVTPLFETVPDLERAEQVLDALFSDAVARPHLTRRGDRQVVMVGYSDSNKDGGFAAARWALHRALHGMARAATRHDVTLTVFHGRGGTVSRGGGSVQRAVSAMPAASIGGRLRLTEQGEVIDAKYGLAPIALRNLERMLGSIVLRAAHGDRSAHAEVWAPMAETIANEARVRYRSLVYEDDRFTDFFRSATPIDVIERMAIGSRPASRRSGAGVRDLRAIPWVFSWTQCRAMLTGWFGLGSGLQAAVEAHGLAELRDAGNRWPFLDALLADVEMVLAKADLGIARRYLALVPEHARPLFDVVQEEFDRTVDLVLRIREESELLSREPTLQRSIRLRNPYVDPMNLLQIDLLGRWRGSEREDDALFDALLASVNGIARGLQNTG